MVITTQVLSHCIHRLAPVEDFTCFVKRGSIVEAAACKAVHVISHKELSLLLHLSEELCVLGLLGAGNVFGVPITTIAGADVITRGCVLAEPSVAVWGQLIIYVFMREVEFMS